MPTCLDFFACPDFAFIQVLVPSWLSCHNLNFVTYPKFVLDPVFFTNQRAELILTFFAIEMVALELTFARDRKLALELVLCHVREFALGLIVSLALEFAPQVIFFVGQKFAQLLIFYHDLEIIPILISFADLMSFNRFSFITYLISFPRFVFLFVLISNLQIVSLFSQGFAQDFSTFDAPICSLNLVSASVQIFLFDSIVAFQLQEVQDFCSSFIQNLVSSQEILDGFDLLPFPFVPLASLIS